MPAFFPKERFSLKAFGGEAFVVVLGW